jgi:hypothetical protein
MSTHCPSKGRGAFAPHFMSGFNAVRLGRIIDAVRAAAVIASNYVLARLRNDSAAQFEQWLDALYPLQAARTLVHVQAMRSGKTYQGGFRLRMRAADLCTKLLADQNSLAHRRLGFVTAAALSTPPVNPAALVQSPSHRGQSQCAVHWQ